MLFRYCTAKSVFKVQIWAKNILQRFDEKLLYLSDSLCVVYKKKEIAIQVAKQRSIIPEKENSEYGKADEQHKKLSGSLTPPGCRVSHPQRSAWCWFAFRDGYLLFLIP